MAEFMTKQKANDKQYGGTHYQCQTIQPWDYVTANNLGYLEGTAIKYITRWRHKNGIEDIRKAIHFLEKLVEVETANRSNQLELFPKLPSGAIMGQARGNGPSVCMAGQSSSQAGNAGVNAGHSTSAACNTDYHTPWASLFPAAPIERAVGGLCPLCAMDEQTGDSFPFCAGELNNMAIIREKRVQP